MNLQERLPLIAASSYLNSAPLIWSFMFGSMRAKVAITNPVPSQCADLLARGAVDAALVPVIEYQRISGIQLVPDVCVGSKERVRSVVLVTRTDDLNRVRSIALDESSRTSAALLRIIFQEFIGSQPTWETSSPNLEEMLEDHDGALIIGDPGMTFSRAGYHVWDLASLWRQYTNLGFVFAMWMVREDAPRSARHLDFARARDEGLSALDQIVNHYEQQLALSRDSIENYLTENISFVPDETMNAGLKLYFELAHKHGLIESVKPLLYQSIVADRMID